MHYGWRIHSNALSCFDNLPLHRINCNILNDTVIEGCMLPSIQHNNEVLLATDATGSVVWWLLTCHLSSSSHPVSLLGTLIFLCSQELKALQLCILLPISLYYFLWILSQKLCLFYFLAFVWDIKVLLVCNSTKECQWNDSSAGYACDLWKCDTMQRLSVKRWQEIRYSS